MDSDVIVVGAGAAGLMAATEAALRGKRVVLLEKNARPGLKILISGGGRCNLTTTRAGADLEREYGAVRGRWLRHVLRSFPPVALRATIEELGVPLREEDLEKVFPVSGRAADVLDALLARAERAGVTLVPRAPMTEVTRTESEFRVATPGGTFAGARLVLATGGRSYPKTGATGDGYPVAEAFGHRVVPTVPHLAPLRVDASWVHELKGIAVEGVLTLRAPEGEVLVRRRRPVLFTHKGLSGPAAMDLAGFVEERPGTCQLDIDFAPELKREEIEQSMIDGARQQGRRAVHRLLPDHLPERLRLALASLAGAEGVAAELGKAARRALVGQVKGTSLPIEASLGFAAAEVTRGGVSLNEIDGRTMESKCTPGLFLCGEVIDVDGPIGGFNFQAAFATGRAAGMHV